jgi:hypothetical protein
MTPPPLRRQTADTQPARPDIGGAAAAVRRVRHLPALWGADMGTPYNHG